MKVTILGTRGEIPESAPYHSKHTGILVDDELLLDLGEKSFLQYNPRWILLTHFHPDHAYFMYRGKEEIPKTTATIFAPEVPPHLKKVVTLLDKKKKLGPYTIQPIPTHHGKYVQSQAYLIKRGKHSFLFTSDLVWIDKKYHPLIRGVDLVITEASFIRKGGMVQKDPKSGRLFGHNGVPNLLSLLKQFSDQFVFIHFGSWFYENIKEGRKTLIKLGKEEDVHVTVGYEGLTINLVN